jgi:glucose-1-phosphate adenylyltransferase
LYRMNFGEMLATHEKAHADVTIAAVPVPSQEAASSGIMRVDESGRVVGFLEKPKTAEELDMVRTDPAWIDRRGIPSRGRDCLASMGIYIFNRDTLVEILDKTNYRDFGKEIFPAAIRSRHVQVHLFDGYWEDIGTIKSFFEANLDLASPEPKFELVSALAPIYTRARFLPPSRIEGASIHRSLLADGCIIDAGAKIENSVIGLRCRIGKNVTIRNSILLGADDYETPYALSSGRTDGYPPVGIGEGTYIDHAILDKNCRIGRHVRIANDHHLDSTEERPQSIIRDGIVVIPKDTTLPDGWKL